MGQISDGRAGLSEATLLRSEKRIMATELVKLRDEVARLRAVSLRNTPSAGGDEDNFWPETKMTALTRAEIARLHRIEEAMKTISTMTSEPDEDGHPTVFVEGAAEVARAALEEEA